jgi:hypothetical protein
VIPSIFRMVVGWRGFHTRSMTSESRFTKQGVRDLNHYGPKAKVAAAEPKAAELPVTAPVPEPVAKAAEPAPMEQ